MSPSQPPGIADADGSVRQFMLLATFPAKPSVFSAFNVLTHNELSPTTTNCCAPPEIAACTCGVTSGVPNGTAVHETSIPAFLKSGSPMPFACAAAGTSTTTTATFLAPESF